MSDRSLTRDRDERQRECIHAFPIGEPHSEQAPGPCERCDLPWGELTPRQQQQVFSDGRFVPVSEEDWTAAEVDLSEAARLCRSTADAMKPGVGAAMAELFDLAGDEMDACGQRRAQHPYLDGTTQIRTHPMTYAAVKLARAMLAAG